MLPADLTNPLLLRLMEYWLAHHSPDGRLPGRAAIDPMTLPIAVLPWLLYVERLENGRYRYRLVGTGVVDLFGHDPTNRFIDTLGDTDEIRLAIARMDEVYATGQPHSSRSPFIGPNREFLTVERLILPFRGDKDGTIRYMLVALAPVDA